MYECITHDTITIRDISPHLLQATRKLIERLRTRVWELDLCNNKCFLFIQLAGRYVSKIRNF